MVAVGSGVDVAVGEGSGVGVADGEGVSVGVAVLVGPGVGVLTLTTAFSPMTISTSCELCASPAEAVIRKFPALASSK
jgi:hypothetical protein